MLICGFGTVGPLSCDKDPLDAGEFMKPSSGLSREHWTRNMHTWMPKHDGRNIMIN